jgi:tight adherence protein C
MMALLLVVGVALLGFAASALVRAIRLPRIHAAENLAQISSYGFGGDVAADPAPIDNQREIAALFGRSIAGRLGDKHLTAIRRDLLAAGMYSITPEGLIGLTVLSILTLPALFAYAFASIGQPAAVVVLMALIGAGMGLVLPRTLVRRRARVRLEAIDYAMPELVDLLVVTMEAGVGFVASLRIAGERLGGPLAEELRLLVQEQTLGASTSAALANWVDRCGPPSVRSFVRTIGQGDRLGVSMGQIMRDLAHEMRARRRQIAEERANRAPVKLLFPLVFLIFPAMFIVLLAPSIKPILDVFGGN